MKEAVSGVSIFQIVILFILLFTAIMCLTINNANAFGVKDEITNIIEMNDGNFFTDECNLSSDIVAAVEGSAYRVSGKCDDGYVGFQRDGKKVSSGQEASICIREVAVTDQLKNYLSGALQTYAPHGKYKASYFQVEVFYQLDIPVIKQIYNFKTKGETKLLYNANMGACL